MGIPTYDRFIEPLLRLLAQHPDGLSTKKVYETLADTVGLSTEDRQELLPSQRQLVFHNRIGWAQDRLKRAGLAQSAARGVWQITAKGRAFLGGQRSPFDEAALDELTYVEAGSKASATEVESATVATETLRGSPDEQIERALAEIRASVARELLEQIGASSPQFFEELVLDLLHALGYGINRQDLQRVGRSGDGGIDGIISLDRLGLEKVYVQAKRWQNRVGRPEVQGFFGALAGRRAKKGVFITTSDFTHDAREFAESVSDQMVIIDGKRLTNLMIEFGVGVQHKALRVPTVDGDYFEEL
ncbi:MAG: restriction endonuclease [Deltaproteobacteria bacterium]|nr:restriction endonuclease [Deltaproteobacteria bacterium]